MMTRRGSGNRRTLPMVVVVVAAAMLTMTAASCLPQEPAPPPPRDIDQMTDAQVDRALVDLLPDVLAGASDPELLDRVPEEHRAAIDTLIRNLQTADGRASIIAQLREESLLLTGGFSQRPDFLPVGEFASEVGLLEGDPVDGTLVGIRSPAPPTSGVSLALPAGTGNCSAPNGPGDVVAPAETNGGRLITPAHDVFTTLTSGGVSNFGVLAPSGVDGITGGPGIEFRTGSRGGQEMHVQVEMEMPRYKWGPAALHPIFKLRPLGGTAAQEYQLSASSGRILCYANDPLGSKRGYFDGWIAAPAIEPGYQLIVELVENDYFFRFGGSNFDLALSGAGPQLFAGADRATVHVGPAPVTNTQALPHSVGAFASATADPGDDTPNVLTDTNNKLSDDIEAPVRGLLTSKVRSAIVDAFADELFDIDAITIDGHLSGQPAVSADLQYVDPRVSFPGMPDEPVGPSRAIEARLTASLDAALDVQLLGMPCYGVTMSADVDVTAAVYADGAPGPGTGITAEKQLSSDPDVSIDMPFANLAFGTCALVYFAGPGKAESELNGKITEAVDDQLGEKGTITKLLDGLDLNSYLPTLDVGPYSVAGGSTGRAVMKPVVTDIHNSWCGAAGAPAGCTGDQDLLGDRGVAVVGDTSLVASLAQSLGGGPLGGRFPNVYSPTTTSTVDDLVTAHEDAVQRRAGLGVVIDPRLVNIALRHIAQGPATGTTTNGLIDIRNVVLPLNGYSMSTRPEVAPMISGVPAGSTLCNAQTCQSGGPNPPSRATAQAIEPDLRVDLVTSPANPRPIPFSVSAVANVAVAFDEATGALRPTIDSPIIDLQVTGGCQVDYVNAYASSYLFCGRGTAGNGGENIETVTDLLDRIADSVVKPVLESTIGSIGLPSLDGILPGAHLALTNVRFAQRGGFVAAYADIRPAPILWLQASPANYTAQNQIQFITAGDNINFQATSGYAWTVKDAISGASVPYGFVPTSNQSGIYINSTGLATEVVLGQTRKRVTATVTFTQSGLVPMTASSDYTYAVPSPPDPPHCPGGQLVANPAAGGRANLVGC